MASYLRPKRGKKSTAESQFGTATPLKRGEIFFEVPDEGVGMGRGKLKMGDGSTGYASLPYFLEVVPDEELINFTNSTVADPDPYETNPGLINNIIPSANLKTIFTNLKKLLLNHNSQLNTMNDNLAGLMEFIDEIKVVDSLPEDAADHPRTLYLSKS